MFWEALTFLLLRCWAAQQRMTTIQRIAVAEKKAQGVERQASVGNTTAFSVERATSTTAREDGSVYTVMA